MSSLRRKSMKISPISVVRSSLVINPVTSVAVVDSVSFSDVLVKAINAPLSNDSANVENDANRSLIRSGKAEAHSAGNAHARKEKSEVPPIAWSPFSDTSADLYTQLETLLREKSLLIAVA